MGDFPSITKSVSRTQSSSILPREQTETFRSSRHKPFEILLGQSSDGEPVALTKKDRKNHTHIIGSTGTGKSKFLEHLIRQDILNRNAGLCLIDPHGSLYEEILLYVSHKHPHLAHRIVLFNPAGESDHVVGFNPVKFSDSKHMNYTLNMLIAACLKAWGQNNPDYTPRIQTWLRNIFYPIVVKDLTLLETMPLMDFYSKVNREKLLAGLSNEMVVNAWSSFEKTSLTQKQNYLEGAVNRLYKFLSHDIIRNIIGVKNNGLDIFQIMQEGKILLVNLNDGGKLDSESTKLLGIMLVNEFFRSAKLRNDRDPLLKPFHLYIDEFGQYVTQDIAKALEECRKYGLFLTLAHQHLAQLKKEDEYLCSSVITNCKNKVVFGGLSQEDSDVMTEEVWTGFVDLLEIKHQTIVTKEHHIEETREVFGESESITKGKSETNTEGISRSKGETLSFAKAKGNSSGSSSGTSSSSTTSSSKGYSEGVGSSNSSGSSSGSSYGLSSGSHSGSMLGESHSESSHGYGLEGLSFTDSSSRSYSSGDSFGESQSWNDSYSSSSGESSYSGTSRMTGKSNSHGSHSSTSYGTNKNKSRGFAKSQGSGESKSLAKGETESITHGKSKNIVPFLKPVEYKEETSRTYWSLQEQMYKRHAEMKNQGVAQAVVKIFEKAPVSTQIAFVEPVFWSPYRDSTQKRIDSFRDKVFLANQSYYTPIEDARREYEDRQRRFFGEPLRFDEQPLIVSDPSDSETPQDNDEVEDPFG